MPPVELKSCAVVSAVQFISAADMTLFAANGDTLSLDPELGVVVATPAPGRRRPEILIPLQNVRQMVRQSEEDKKKAAAKAEQDKKELEAANKLREENKKRNPRAAGVEKYVRDPETGEMKVEKV